MEIEFSDHAKEQIKRRGISQKKINEAVEVGKQKSSFKNRKVYQKTFANKVLEVVCVKEETKLIIITAYYLYEDKLRS